MPSMAHLPSRPLIGLLLIFASATIPARGSCQEMRTLQGRYVRIVTDLPDSADQRTWTAAFDAAVPLWCEFWDVPLEAVHDWRVEAYVMSAKQPFLDRGMIPAELPDFPHGYQMSNAIWVVGQASEYYTRHLLLHEGAHAFAFHNFGGAGPPWYMEGTAEFLATHHWDGQRLVIGIVPESNEAVPYWGRFAMIDRRRDEGRALTLASVLRYSDTAHRQVEPYAWTWAGIVLFEMYPESRRALIAAAREGRDATPQFTRQFINSLADQWPLAQARWRILIDEFDYGYDTRRNRIDIDGDEPRWDGSPRRVEIRADRGWQSCGVKIPAGTRIGIAAEGSVVIAEEPEPWVVEPQGVTIRYHDGHPIGMLVGALLPTAAPNGTRCPPLRKAAVGRSAEMIATEESWLLLRVGDATGELADNRGSFLVEITAK